MSTALDSYEDILHCKLSSAFETCSRQPAEAHTDAGKIEGIVRGAIIEPVATMKEAINTAPKLAQLPYRKPTLGRDYWILDDALPNAIALRERCLARKDWTFGFPYRDEGWPGMRALPALDQTELAVVESWALQQTGMRRFWVANAAAAGTLVNHNCVQVVGASESGSRPHTDSRKNCRFAAVLYLTPAGSANCGTTFYRQKNPNGTLGGNLVIGPHPTLVEALGSRFVPRDSFVEDVSVEYRFNRLLLYRADLIHSASGYFGEKPAERRMAAVFFWMAD